MVLNRLSQICDFWFRWEIKDRCRLVGLWSSTSTPRAVATLYAQLFKLVRVSFTTTGYRGRRATLVMCLGKSQSEQEAERGWTHIIGSRWVCNPWGLEQGGGPDMSITYTVLLGLSCMLLSALINSASTRTNIRNSGTENQTTLVYILFKQEVDSLLSSVAPPRYPPSPACLE